MNKVSNFSLIKTFLPYFKPYKKILFIDLFCAALTTVCDIVFPLIIRFITGQNGDAPLLVSTVIKLGLFYIVLRVIDAAANYYMAYTGHCMGAKIETDMRSDFFSHLQDLSFSYYDDTKVGTLMSRMTNDLFDVTEFAHHCPEEFFIAGIKIVASFVILCGMNIWLTLLTFAMLPLMFVFSLKYNRKMRDAFKASRVQVGELNANVEDNLLGIRVVKSFANENDERKKFHKDNSKFLDIKAMAYRCMAAFQTGIRLFDGIMYITVTVVGAIFMINQQITAADLVAYLLYVTTLLTSVRRIVEFTEQFQKGMTGIERFAEVMDTPVEITDAPDAIEIDHAQGNITFEHVSFKYNENNRHVLSNINLSITPGESIAIVGPSGGGKTTLCSLIPRFYEVTGGRILLDGRDIKKITQHSLRNQIGVVQQDVYLFCGSIYENICYGKQDCTMEEVVEAAKKAGAHEFISQLPDGYDTYVGERGVKLSGGQKQRVSIARLFLKNPPILILDEATSALDNESERLIQASLEQLAKGRTTFTIAHRLTTIKNASTILVLTEHGIEECGTHEELLAKGGIYSEMYRLYAR